MVLKSIIIGGLFIVGIAYGLFAYIYPNSGNNGTSGGIDVGATAKLIHQYVNDERTKAGLPSLTWNDNIATLAFAHSQDMLTKNYYEHDSPDGVTLEARAGIGLEVKVAAR